MGNVIVRCLSAVCLSLFLTCNVAAQSLGVEQSDLLVLDTERLFSETLFGKRMTVDYQAAREQLSTQNRKIEAELEAEEQMLTDLRAETSPEAFKEMADAFDAKVQELRRSSDSRVRELERRRDLAPVAFMRAVEPILVELLVETGGSVLLDKRSVLLRRDVVDITDIAIKRIDQSIGDGQSSKDAEIEGNSENEAVQE